MKEYSFLPINNKLIAKCHELNEKNVPNVGSRTLEGLSNSIENSILLNDVENPSQSFKLFSQKMMRNSVFG